MRSTPVELAVLFLIILSIALIILEAIFPDGFCIGFDITEISEILTAIFIIELTLRYCGSSSSKAYFREYWLDIIAVLPVARVFRILRLLRLFRLFRAGKILNRRIRRFSNVFVEWITEYLFFVLLILIVVLAGALAITSIEGKSNEDFSTFEKSFWWSVYSLMAGEPVSGTAQTTAGRLVSVVVMFGGITIFALLTGVFSAFMVKRMRFSMKGNPMELEELRDHIIICGWNRSGHLIVEEFQSEETQKNKPIVIIAELETEPHFNWSIVKPELIYFLSADYTQVSALTKCSVARASIAILLADKSKERTDQDRDARTVLAAMIIEKMNSSIFTCVELLNRDNETHLKMAGVEDVIVTNEYAGTIIASAARNQGGIVPMINEILTSKFGNQFYKTPISEEWVGSKSIEIFQWLKNECNAILVSIERERAGRQETIVNPSPDLILQENDKLIMIATRNVDLTKKTRAK
jgi:voltage-gated potassium channel